MVAIYFIILLVVALLLWLLIVRASKGIPRTVDQLRVPIDDLISRGFDQGCLVFTHRKNKTFIQFRKYKSRRGEGIVFGFPDAAWSADLFESVKAAAVNAGLNPVEVDNGMRFVEVDFGKDAGAAYQFVRSLLLDVFGYDAADKYYVLLSGASVR